MSDVVLYGAQREATDPPTLARLIGSGLFPEPQPSGTGPTCP